MINKKDFTIADLFIKVSHFDMSYVHYSWFLAVIEMIAPVSYNKI